jgi:hypothetical protein
MARGLRRLGYRLGYVILTVSGRAAARLAADFRTLGSVDARLRIVALVLQTPVIACWVVVRAISVAAFAGCAAFAPAR